MKQTRLIMGMPIIIEIVDKNISANIFEEIFDYFRYIDQKFSTYKDTSEISLINSNKILKEDYSPDMQLILSLCEETKNLTNGYFDIKKNNMLDPSGIVKGWSILQASKLLTNKGYKNYYINAGGDIQTSGRSSSGNKWEIGIRNPFNVKEIIKTLSLDGWSVATSGSYERGHHIYNPKNPVKVIYEIVSITVIAKDILEADRFATAAFAMETEGINFIEKMEGLEGMSVDKNGIATYTSGFHKFERSI